MVCGTVSSSMVCFRLLLYQNSFHTFYLAMELRKTWSSPTAETEVENVQLLLSGIADIFPITIFVTFAPVPVTQIPFSHSTPSGLSLIYCNTDVSVM